MQLVVFPAKSIQSIPPEHIACYLSPYILYRYRYSSASRSLIVYTKSSSSSSTRSHTHIRHQLKLLHPPTKDFLVTWLLAPSLLTPRSSSPKPQNKLWTYAQEPIAGSSPLTAPQISHDAGTAHHASSHSADRNFDPIESRAC